MGLWVPGKEEMGLARKRERKGLEREVEAVDEEEMRRRGVAVVVVAVVVVMIAKLFSIFDDVLVFILGR